MDFSFHLGTFGTQLGHPNGHEISLGATNSWRPTAPIFGAQGVWFFCLLSQNTRICSLKNSILPTHFFFKGCLCQFFFLGGVIWNANNTVVVDDEENVEPNVITWPPIVWWSKQGNQGIGRSWLSRTSCLSGYPIVSYFVPIPMMRYFVSPSEKSQLRSKQ